VCRWVWVGGECVGVRVWLVVGVCGCVGVGGWVVGGGGGGGGVGGGAEYQLE